MAGRMTLSFVDANRQVSQCSFDGVTIIDANYGIQETAQIALRDAVLAIVDGTLKASLVGGNYNSTGVNIASDPNAQTSIRWRVWYMDDVTGDRQSLTIPCADLDLSVPQDSSGITYMKLDTSAGAGATFKAAFEAYVVSKDGNPVHITGVDFTG